LRVKIGELRRSPPEALLNPVVLLGARADELLEVGDETARVLDRIVARESIERRVETDFVAGSVL
jgi:hypothetical protein